MKYLYLLTQDERTGYDTYDSMVVCAANEVIASNIHPAVWYSIGNDKKWGGDQHETWASEPSRVTVKLLGRARDDLPLGIVCASFNAG